MAVACEIGKLAGLREDRNIRGIATLDLDVDLGLPVGGTEVGDLNAVFLTPGTENFLDCSSFVLVTFGVQSR